MDKSTAEAIAERAEGIVASVWRSGRNIGIEFFKNGKCYTWEEMTDKEREHTVQNLLYASTSLFCAYKDNCPLMQKKEEHKENK